MDIFKKELKNQTFFEAGDQTRLTEVYHPKNDEHIKLPYSLAFASIKVGNKSLLHRLKQEEMYIFTQGVGSITIGKNNFKVEKGTHILVPGGVDQEVTNEGSEALEFYCIVSPPWEEKDELIL